MSIRSLSWVGRMNVREINLSLSSYRIIYWRRDIYDSFILRQLPTLSIHIICWKLGKCKKYPKIRPKKKFYRIYTYYINGKLKKKKKNWVQSVARMTENHHDSWRMTKLYIFSISQMIYRTITKSLNAKYWWRS